MSAPGRTAAMVLALALSGPPPAGAAPLAHARRLAAVYDLILDARFAAGEAALARTCPPAPPVACELLGATVLWWRLQLDERSTAFDAELNDRIARVVASAERWTAEEPLRAEAWFYLGAAYGARVQWRALRDQRLAAARDGRRARDALERALAIEPGLHDARLGIGLYKYYAAVLPVGARILRFLLLLPGGNRAEGRADIMIARERGVLLGGDADYQLHWIDLWYEGAAPRALATLERLRARYPHNPLFARRIAEVEVEYLHDPSAALATWLSLIEAAEDDTTAEPAATAARARLGAAEQYDTLFETDRAIELAGAVAAERPAAPVGVLAQAYALLGRFEDRMNRRADAVAAYRAAIAAAPPGDPLGTAARARAALRARPDPRAAEARRLSIAGWRAFERGALDTAQAALDEALALGPRDPVTAWRRAAVHRARGDHQAAIAALDGVIAARPAAPPVFLARALIDRAAIHERRGQRDVAIADYRRASGVFGADADTRARAARAAARLQGAAPPPQ